LNRDVVDRQLLCPLRGIYSIDDTVLAEFSNCGVDIETELERWVSGFVEREGRPPSTVEVGKAHKTIMLATRTA
jgi:hypothetical protein